MPEIKLKLDGKQLDLNPAPYAVSKIKALLDQSPADEIYSSMELSRKVGLYRTTVQTSTVWGHQELKQYMVLRGRNRYWGNPKAIKALREQAAL